MVKLNLANFNLLNEDEQNYAREHIGMFIDKLSILTKEADTLDLSFSKKRDKEKDKLELRGILVCNYGLITASKTGWNNFKVIKGTLNSIETQIKKKKKH